MPCTAIVKYEYQEKYYIFIELLARGEFHKTRIARLVTEEYVKRHPDKENEPALAVSTLYDWAKRDTFKVDLDKAVRGLLPLNLRSVINTQKMKAELTGDTPAAKFYVENETATLGVGDKIEIEAFNADSVVSGVLASIKARELPNDPNT